MIIRLALKEGGTRVIDTSSMNKQDKLLLKKVLLHLIVEEKERRAVLDGFSSSELQQVYLEDLHRGAGGGGGESQKNKNKKKVNKKMPPLMSWGEYVKSI